jgi:hypothetical protein
MYYSSRREDHEYVNEDLKSNIMLIQEVTDKVFHIAEDNKATEVHPEEVIWPIFI